MSSYEHRKMFARRRRLVNAFDASRRHRLEALLPSKPDASRMATLEQVSNPEVLIRVFDEMATTAGPGAGPDGVSYQDISRSQMCAIMREVSQELKNGSFVPSRARTVTVAKAQGRGKRKLSLRSILFRIVAGSVLRHVSPYLESIFLDRSYGFRSARGPWNMLAAIERDMLTSGKLVLMQDDIMNAFDHVPIDPVVAELRRHFADEGLSSLFATLLRGNNPRQTRGIDQGSPVSPAALNILLHAHLDQWLDGQGEYLPWHRYADNVVVLAQGMPEAGHLHQLVKQRLLAAGFTLKGKDPAANLGTRGLAECLGFNLTLGNGRLKLDLTSGSWRNLEDNLLRCWNVAHPSQCAQEVAEGWTAAQGPALESGKRMATIERVLRKATRLGFRGIQPERLERAAQVAHERWEALRALPTGEMPQTPAPPAAATPPSVA